MAKKKTDTNNECTHEFVATGGKGVWEVQAISLNKRGKPRTQRVNTTVFECKKCGQKKEYPDTWEKNYLLPRAGEGVAAGDSAAPRAKASVAPRAKASATPRAKTAKKAAPKKKTQAGA
jgi:hypothetical protein